MSDRDIKDKVIDFWNVPYVSRMVVVEQEKAGRQTEHRTLPWWFWASEKDVVMLEKSQNERRSGFHPPPAACTRDAGEGRNYPDHQGQDLWKWRRRAKWDRTDMSSNLRHLCI